MKEKDKLIKNPYQLIKETAVARKNGQLSRAEKLIRETLNIEPDNIYAPAQLCSILSEKREPGRAIAETEKYRILNPKNFSLRISRASAFCDLEQWEKAKGELGLVLAKGDNESKKFAFAVVKRIKKARPDLYSGRDSD